MADGTTNDDFLTQVKNAFVAPWDSTVAAPASHVAVAYGLTGLIVSRILLSK